MTDKVVICEDGDPSVWKDAEGLWVCLSHEPDYMAGGNTKEEAILNYWEGLARTLLLHQNSEKTERTP